MFALIYDTFDYTNQKFITHKEAAMEEFAQEKESAINGDSDDIRGICLFEITSDGEFHMSEDFTSSDGITILDKWVPDED